MKTIREEKVLILLIVVMTMLTSIAATWAAAGSCDGCKRRAVVGEVKSNHPFYIMNGTGGLKSSIRSRLVETLTSKYFRILNPDIKSRFEAIGLNSHPPEYTFKANFEIGLNIPRDDRKPAVSRLTITAFYNGEHEEKISEWASESSLPDYASHTRIMFRNRDAVMKKAKPFENILWEFERRPAKCVVDMKGKISLKPGEEVDIELKDFQDEKGRTPKPFQRLVLQAKEGKILNGEPLKADKDLKAFVIGNGSVKVRYKAPESAGITEDTLWINSSCEILPKDVIPLSETSIHGTIAEQAIPLGTVIVIHVEETSSGSCSDEYPFSYKVSMEFRGQSEKLPDEKTFGKEGAKTLQTVLNQSAKPPEIRKIDKENQARLLSRLLPYEKSMKVLQWKCTDPLNDSPPSERFPRGVAAAHIPESAAEIWVIGEKAYITRGIVDGILGYFASWEDDDELSKSQEQPMGARVGSTWGDMNPYIEIPLNKLKSDKPYTFTRKHNGTDGDVWKWNTSWKITITCSGE